MVLCMLIVETLATECQHACSEKLFVFVETFIRLGHGSLEHTYVLSSQPSSVQSAVSEIAPASQHVISLQDCVYLRLPSARLSKLHICRCPLAP